MTPAMTIGFGSCLSGAAGGETVITAAIGMNGDTAMYFGMEEVTVAPEDIDAATVDFANGEGALPLRDFLTLGEDGYWHGEVSNYQRVRYTEAGAYEIVVKGARSINFTKTYVYPGQGGSSATVVENSSRVMRFFSNDPRLVEIPERALFFSELLEEVDVSLSGVKSIGEMAFAYGAGGTIRLPPVADFSFASSAFGGTNVTVYIPVPKASFVSSDLFPYGAVSSIWHFSDGDVEREP